MTSEDARNPSDTGTSGNKNEVGYCKPPVTHRFKKGQSGNPRGRPKKKRAIDNLLEPISAVIGEELRRLIPVREGDNRSEIPAIQAVIRKVMVGAASGNSRLQQAVLKMALQFEETRKAALKQDYTFAHDYHDYWRPIFTLALRYGSEEPTQLPHPAHIKFDAETGQVTICGPIDRRMKIGWEWLKLSLRTQESAYEQVKGMADAKPKNKHLARVVVELKDMLTKMERDVPGHWNWREELGWEKQWEEYFNDMQTSQPQRLIKILRGDCDAVIP